MMRFPLRTRVLSNTIYNSKNSHYYFKNSFDNLTYTLFAQSASSLPWGKMAWWGVPPIKCPGYDIKQSDGENLVMQELWGMWSTTLLPLLPGPLWPGVVAPDGAQSMC